jgi:SCP-2 sterol transfer family
VATRKEVEAKLRELIRRLDQAGYEPQRQLAKALPQSRIIQIEVPDVDGRYWTELAGGKLKAVHAGAAKDGSDIRVTAASDHLIAMIDGNKNLFTSYLAGHIRVRASLSDLAALRKLM